MNDNKELVVITGVSGRVGSNLVRHLGEKYNIVGFDINKGENLADSVDFVQVDLTSSKSVANGFKYIAEKYGRIASIVHLAAYYSFSGEPSDLYQKITVAGSKRMLLAGKKAGCEQFIFSSTMLVHQPTKPGISITEKSPVAARWAYPQSKVDTENMMIKEHGNVPIVMMRIAGCYDDQCHSIPISQQAVRIFERSLEAHVFSGDISHGAAFVHLDDVSSAIVKAIEKRNKLPKQFPVLIGEDKTYSYDQLQKGIAKFLLDEDDWTTHQIPKGAAEIGAWMQNHIPFVEKPFVKPWMIHLADDHYELDISEAKTKLGWTAKYDIRDHLPTMLKKLHSDPSSWYKIQNIKAPKWVKAMNK